MDINTVDTIITCPKSVPKAGTAGRISRKLVGQWDSDPLETINDFLAGTYSSEREAQNVPAWDTLRWDEYSWKVFSKKGLCALWLSVTDRPLS